MAINYNNVTDTTVTSATGTPPRTAWNKEFYDRKLLERAQTKLVYANFAQKRSIPKMSGKHVEFRRYSPFGVDTASLELTEGVTPDSQAISQTTVEATVKQYGAYVEVSDLLDLTAYDPVISDAADLLGEQMGTLIDHLNRDALVAEASAQYAGGATGKNAIGTTSYFTLQEARKAATTLRKAKARPFTDGGDHYVCIISPDQAYDLQGDSTWKEIAVHVDPSRSESGEIGRCYGVAFCVSTEAPVESQSVLNTVSSATGYTITLASAPSDAGVKYLSTAGNIIYVDISGTPTPFTIVSYAEASKVITVEESVSSVSSTDIVFSKDCGNLAASTYKGSDCHHALIFGADAYGNIDIAGSGAVQVITKRAGDGDTSDPLNQRSTIGAKILAYCAKVLNSMWVVDIMTSAS